MRNKLKLTIILLIAVFISSSIAQDSTYLQKNYIKKEFKVPMRDGKELFTAVYMPKDNSKEYPIILLRTPYNIAPYGESKYKRSIPYEKEGFIFAYQDVRGRFMSEGDYVNMRPYIENKLENEIDETTDTYDTVEWLVDNIPNNNGNVGLWGISYPGFYAAMGCIDSHPALKCVSPQAPIADWFIGDDMHHNGAFSLSLNYLFFSVFGQERDTLTTKWPARPNAKFADAYDYFLNLGPIRTIEDSIFQGKIDFWTQQMTHGSYDKFWKSRSTMQHFENLSPAVMVVGGWYDAEDLYGEINTYEAIEEKNPDAYNILVMGPWDHGGWKRKKGDKFGQLEFDSPTSNYYQENIELPFFNHFLKGEENPNLPEAYIFETGNNKWHKFEQWPPENTEEKSLYMNNKSTLTFEPPENYSYFSFDKYISDPANPVPYTAEFHTMNKFYKRTYPVEDQRFASARPDVLDYSSEVLEEDLTIAGPIEAELYVSTTGTDSDWIVKVIDVYPEIDYKTNRESKEYEMAGAEILVRGEIMRGKFRESYSIPRPFKPGKVTKVKFTLNDVMHTFKKGHRVMVQIQSSWFPLFDRNPQKFVDIYTCTADDFQKAEQKVYRSSEYPSRIKFKILR